MMATIREISGIFFLLFGLFFCVVGVIGLVRFPDVFTRIHAAGKVSTLGAYGLLLGTAIIMPDALLKVLALAIFMIAIQPVSSHAVATAAYRSGLRMKVGQRDDLASRFNPAEGRAIDHK